MFLIYDDTNEDTVDEYFYCFTEFPENMKIKLVIKSRVTFYCRKNGQKSLKNHHVVLIFQDNSTEFSELSPLPISHQMHNQPLLYVYKYKKIQCFC